jgi:hypothetical protein
MDDRRLKLGVNQINLMGQDAPDADRGHAQGRFMFWDDLLATSTTIAVSAGSI